MQEDEDIFGDGVNIAARLQEIAEPGGIAVSETVNENLSGRIDPRFINAGPYQLKNIERPVKIWYWSGPASQIAVGVAEDAVPPVSPARKSRMKCELPERPSSACSHPVLARPGRRGCGPMGTSKNVAIQLDADRIAHLGSMTWRC